MISINVIWFQISMPLKFELLIKNKNFQFFIRLFISNSCLSNLTARLISKINIMKYMNIMNKMNIINIRNEFRTGQICECYLFVKSDFSCGFNLWIFSCLIVELVDLELYQTEIETNVYPFCFVEIVYLFREIYFYL